MISYIQSSFFYHHYYYFGHTTYHQKLCHLKTPRKMTIRPHVPVEIIRVFLISDFSRNSQSQKKLAKKITYFTIQFRSKNFTHFKKLNLLDIENSQTNATQPKTFLTLKVFQETCFWLVSEKTFALYQFLDAKELHSQSTLKANVCVFLHISVRKFLFQRRRKFLSGGRGVGAWRRQNNYIKEVQCFGFVKYFTSFHFN